MNWRQCYLKLLLDCDVDCCCCCLCSQQSLVTVSWLGTSFHTLYYAPVMKICLFPWFKADSFVRFISLSWLLWSLRTWNILLQALRTYKISSEKSDVILTGFPLEVFNILSLFYTLTAVLPMMFLLLSVWCSETSSVHVSISLFSLGTFSSMILLKMWSTPLTWVFSLFCAYGLKVAFSWYLTLPFLCCFIFVFFVYLV